MGSVLQGVIVWTGFTGAPGYTNLYTRFAGIITSNVDNLVTGLNKFCLDIQPQLPTTVTVTPSTTVKQFDEVTGVLTNVYTAATAPVPKTGTLTPQGPSPVGACISWGTAGVNRGRTIRGRTFLVPLWQGSFEGNGSLTTAALATFNTAALNWRTSSAYETVIWSRPRLGTGGMASDILSHRITDQAAVLRSRRD